MVCVEAKQHWTWFLEGHSESLGTVWRGRWSWALIVSWLSFASGFNRLVFHGLCLCDSFVQCCLTSTETLRTIPPQRPYGLYLHRDLTDYTSTETLQTIPPQRLYGLYSTETLRTVRAGEPRTSISDFTQPLSSDLWLGRTAVERASCGGHKLLRTGVVPLPY